MGPTKHPCKHAVTVYHDETSDAGPGHLKGHVLFWVPDHIYGEYRTPLFGSEPFEYQPDDLLFTRVKQIRTDNNYDTRFHFCKISGSKWTQWDVPLLEATSVAVDALRRKFQKQFDRPLCCKLAILFYPKKSDLSLYGGSHGKERHQRHDETVLRMLLKGAAHYLYNEDTYINLRRIISDGDPRHRPLDPERIVWRLLADDGGEKVPLREYISFAEDVTIEHVPSNHRLHDEEHAHYRYAHHLQLADLLLGGVIHACHKGCHTYEPPPLDTPVHNKRDIIATPVKRMLDKQFRGFGFRASGHFRSFTVSQVEFGNEGVIFRQVATRDIKPVLENLQQELDYDWSNKASKT